MGLGQVNSGNLQSLGLSVEDVFDDCKNLAASASILHENYQRARKVASSDQEALHMALSLYNTGSMSAGFANGYVGLVMGNAQNLVASTVPALVPIPLVPKNQPKAKAERVRERAGSAAPAAAAEAPKAATKPATAPQRCPG
ncbi:transglycosylase SLT domain-containing protein [Pseudomonas sp. JG-B]|uniref:transglycosylase SLT domain-containing protein n=1 Tax=Pseudomonas sp. JG-B TaxID=2603214 RepID=UPI0021143C8B|nr:transglycosylase SLT domain-containing protein [Pseudomonas sp. JG-B]